MKKYINYIIDTFICHFSKHFQLKNARVKWLTYHLGKVEDENLIIIESSQISHWNVSVEGKKNEIAIKNGSRITYGGILIHGENNSVTFNGCTGIASLTIRGNNCKVSIGKDTSMENLYMICMGNENSIVIGDDCMFSGDVEIWNSDTHLITDIEGNPLNHKPAPVTVGNHVWLGKHVKVLKGVNIGDNSIVGMSSVITRSISSNVVAVGNPARVVKEGVTWEKGFITDKNY